MADKTTKPVRGIPARPEKKKVLPAVPERVYDQWAIAEIQFAGPNIGPKITGGHIGFIRYRDMPDGPEEDPEGEVVPAMVQNLYAMAADPAWPEAKALLDAAVAFAMRLGTEQRVF